MSKTITAALIAAALSVGAVGCNAEAPAPEETSSAVPGMGGETEPSLGTGESDAPDQ